MKPIDFDLLFLDLTEAFHRDPKQAAAALQALLLDETACRQRIALLHSLAEHAHEDLPERGLRDPDRFDAAIRLLAEVGVFRALEERRLAPEELAALCGDPDALWRAHRTILAEEVPEEIGEFTHICNERDWTRLEEQVRPYLPIVLRIVELDQVFVDPFLRFLLGRAQEEAGSGRRFRDLLPEWLEQFAHELRLEKPPRPLRREDWESILEEGALRVILDEEPAGEPEWARQFRAVARRLARSRHDLLRLRLDDPSPAAALPGFRRRLFVRAEQERVKASRFFEVSLN